MTSDNREWTQSRDALVNAITSLEYSIKSLAEAKAYLEHPILGKNIRGILEHFSEGA